jgi:predicted PurR-regulated permease PerM
MKWMVMLRLLPSTAFSRLRVNLDDTFNDRFPPMNLPPERDLLRITLAVFCIAVLTLASFWVLRPFVPALTWATMVVVTTWPLMLRVQRGLRNRRWLAVAVMTVTMLTLFVVPLVTAIGTLAENADEIGHWVAGLGEVALPLPPDWVKSIPVVGAHADTAWRDLAAAGPEELARQLKPYLTRALHWLASEAGGLGKLAVQLLLTIVLSAVLFWRGEAAASLVKGFAHRLAGERGVEAVRLAGQAIRAVALGVVVTAVVQTLLGWLGLAVAGVPFASLLAAAMLLLAIAQIGVVPVMLCAVGWLYWKDMTGAATGLLVWTVFVGAIDNVVRPILIRQGADLPLLLIFAGVIGGLIGFGLVGLFVGPVVLGVSYTLLRAWIDEGRGGRGGSLPKP